MSLPAMALNYLESLYEQALEEGYDEEQAKEIKRSSRCERSIESLGEVLETREGTPATCGVFAASSDVV